MAASFPVSGIIPDDTVMGQSFLAQPAVTAAVAPTPAIQPTGPKV